ncbi:outer membrane beta-barrel protein [Proteiniphilum sp. X52]|uniref:outer membrane beta-barrel protein n=1 Tax=Proteiniphilum sp. X52 TaxID=2382159 RepID=UPI000F0A7D51|nr:outer membrane beta-barrel protein [Proteiniphilum sp. X52]RNC65157.1 hypothetical protein D7D25_08285 [Proteiniphilum sp. X52]
MKSIIRLIVLTVLSGLMFSCAPKVVTQLIKSYPPLPETEEVIVYEREKDDTVPAGAETIGNIAVVDNGFSTKAKGSFEQVVELASEETRKNGGNGLLITDHLKPSFWGSTIHQIAGVMLKVDTTDTDFVSSREAYVSIQEDNERKRINIPVHTLMINTGYGNLGGNTDGFGSEEKKMVDKLHQGITWDVRYYYHHKGFPYGVGLMVSQFYSSPFQELVYNNMKNNVRLDYAGLSFGWRNAFSPKWIGSLYFGLGYLGIMQKFSNPGNPSEYGTLTGSTVGPHFGVGFEYQVSKRIGIGVDLTEISGYLTSVNYNNLTRDPSSPEISSENRLNVSRINATVGVRYYLK